MVAVGGVVNTGNRSNSNAECREIPETWEHQTFIICPSASVQF